MLPTRRVELIAWDSIAGPHWLQPTRQTQLWPQQPAKTGEYISEKYKKNNNNQCLSTGVEKHVYKSLLTLSFDINNLAKIPLKGNWGNKNTLIRLGTTCEDFRYTCG